MHETGPLIFVLWLCNLPKIFSELQVYLWWDNRFLFPLIRRCCVWVEMEAVEVVIQQVFTDPAVYSGNGNFNITQWGVHNSNMDVASPEVSKWGIGFWFCFPIRLPLFLPPRSLQLGNTRAPSILLLNPSVPGWVPASAEQKLIRGYESYKQPQLHCGW